MEHDEQPGRAVTEASRTTAQPLQNLVLRCGTGERLFSEGDLGASMFIIQSGKVRLFRLADGHKRTQAILEKGDFFGESSVIEGLPRANSAETLEDSELIEVNTTTFDRMIRSNIEIAVRILRKMSVRLREAERRLDDLDVGGGPLAPAPRAALPSTHAVPAGTGVRLEVEGQGTVFPLSESESMLGRYDPISNLKPDVDLSAVDLKRSVSRCHARIFRTETGHAIAEEAGALNGTLVNGTPIGSGQPHPLCDGDRITIGAVRLVFRS